MQQLIETIKEKTKELNVVLEEAAMQKLIVKMTASSGLTIRNSAPIAHLQVEFFQKLS